MAMGDQVLPTASVRVDTGLGRVFLTALSGEGHKAEIAIDVFPSQMPRIAAAFAAGEPPSSDRLEMSPEELEDLKGKIMKMTRPRVRFYPGEIAVELGIEYDAVIEAMYSLEKEGKIRGLDE